MIERRERFRLLYDANYEGIVGYARRRTMSADDARDVVSETFLIAWRRLDDVPPGDRARLWLYGTARRVLANHHRGRKRQTRLLARLETEPTAAASDPFDGVDHDDLRRLTEAFERLDGADQEVLLLAGWEELDAGQIAQVIGCARSSARVRLHRARRRFAAALGTATKRSEVAGHEASRWVTARPDTEETP